jgi:Brp/Blh family beta-carotene 15,15'-monooxygenase
LPLPLGFALYFSCWHSINTLTDIHQFLTNNHAQKKQLWHILKSGSPFILLTWAGIVLALYGIQQSSQPQNILSLLFISISILTLPHVGVMSIMLNKYSKQSQN